MMNWTNNNISVDKLIKYSTITIFHYNQQKNRFIRLHPNTYKFK